MFLEITTVVRKSFSVELAITLGGPCTDYLAFYETSPCDGFQVLRSGAFPSAILAVQPFACSSSTLRPILLGK